LRRVFADLPNAHTVEDIEALLPYSTESDNTENIKIAVG